MQNRTGAHPRGSYGGSVAMARLERPYIPLSVRVQVAARQLRERWLAGDKLAGSVLYGLSLSTDRDAGDPTMSDSKRLRALLGALFADRPCALDHDPALVNRRRVRRRVKGKMVTAYSPDANDPRYLVYRESGPVGGGSEHDIKTRVRGDHGQLSDLGLARKEKRRRRRAARLKVTPTEGRLRKGMKITGTIGVGRIVSAPLRSANRWPPKGSRKLRGRW